MSRLTIISKSYSNSFWYNSELGYSLFNLASISDLTLYVFSYLIDQKNLKENEAEEVFNNIINLEYLGNIHAF